MSRKKSREPLEPYRRPFDWAGAVVHFIFGAGIGALVGWGVSAQIESGSGWIIPS